jgi:hypothetical protein
MAITLSEKEHAELLAIAKACGQAASRVVAAAVSYFAQLPTKRQRALLEAVGAYPKKIGR